MTLVTDWHPGSVAELGPEFPELPPSRPGYLHAMQLLRTAAIVALSACASAFAFAGVLAVGDEVPDVTLAMADGTDSKLSSREGRAVILFFYGTWSKKAPDDAARLDALRKLRAKQKLDVIGVARDAKPADAKKFGEDNKLGFPQAADAKGDLFKRFSEKGLPWVVLIDGKRKLRYSGGGVDDEAIETALVEVLGKRDPEKPKDPAPPKK